MKYLDEVKSTQLPAIFAGVLLLLAATFRVDAWDQKFTFTQHDNESVVLWPSYSGVHYVFATATLGSTAISQIVQNGQVRCVAAVQSTGPRSKCSSGWVQIGGGAASYDASATIASGGEATCIGYDNNSQYYQQALCPQQPSL